jgi:hypothetical protein
MAEPDLSEEYVGGDRVLAELLKLAADLAVLRATAEEHGLQDARMETQQAEIATHIDDVLAEVKKLASDVVDVRDRVARLEERAGAVAAIPMRPRLPSLTGEEVTTAKAVTESVRAAAVVQSVELPKQTSLMQAQAAELPKQTEIMKEQAALAAQRDEERKEESRKRSLRTLLMFLAGLLAFATQALATWGAHH